MYFFDWLSIKQTHTLPDGVSLPVFCKLHSIHTDHDTGEQFDTRSRGQHEGSYSTVLSIRCDGATVEVSGNPSRIDRLDNLFGVSELGHCVLIYNRILRLYGLPSFTPAVVFHTPVKWTDPNEFFTAYPITSDSRFIAGAVIQELHVTCNYSVGKGNEHKFYRGISSFKHRSRLPKLYQTGVTWGEGSRRLYFGFYSKGAEFDVPRQQARLAKLMYSGQINQNELDYYDKVKSYCVDNGVVRLEYKLKNNWLRDKGYRLYNPNLNANDIAKSDLMIAEKWIDSMSVSNISYDNIALRLVDLGVCTDRASRVTESVFIRWLHGMDHGLAKSQFYTHKKRLLSLGIDISLPCDVTSLRVHIRSEELNIQPLAVPDWYLMAA